MTPRLCVQVPVSVLFTFLSPFILIVSGTCLNAFCHLFKRTYTAGARDARSAKVS